MPAAGRRESHINNVRLGREGKEGKEEELGNFSPGS